MRHIRIAIIGAGLAGLATAAAFSRAGHDVQVFEQADGLRATGIAISLWSNATLLLPGPGIPAGRISGEPFSGRSGKPASPPTLPKCPRGPARACSGRGPSSAYGGGRVTRFAEQAAREPGHGAQLLKDLAEDEDPVIRKLAQATPLQQWTEWQARDMWPRRTLHRSEAARVPRVRRIAAMTRAGAMARRSNAASRVMPATMTARLTTLSGGPVLRRITPPVVAEC